MTVVTWLRRNAAEALALTACLLLGLGLAYACARMFEACS